MLGLRSRSQLLHSSCSSSRSPRVHPLARIHIHPRRVLVRPSTRCDAGRRPGSARSAAGSADVPQGSALERMITLSIRNIDNDSPSALQELADVVHEWGSSFNFIHTSAAFAKAANLKRVEPAAAAQLLDTLAGVWNAVLPSAEPQALANVLWACGKLRFINARLWSYTLEAVSDKVQRSSQEFVGVDVSNTLHGLANAAAANKGQVPGVSRAEVEAVVQPLMQHMSVLCKHPQLEGVTSQNVSNVLWGCAKLRINPGRATLDSMLQALARPKLLEEMSPQHLSNAIWAVSELQQHCSWQPQVDQRVWQRLLVEMPMKRFADAGRHQEVSNLVLALVRLSVAPSAAAAAAADVNAAAVAVLSQDFARQVAQQVLQGRHAQQLERWSPQAVSNSLWACGRLGLYNANFVDNAAAAAPIWLRNAARPTIEQVAIACNLLQYSQNQLMERAVQHTAQLLSPRHVAATDAARSIGMVAVVAYSVAELDMQQLAGNVRKLVASTGVTHSTRLHPADAGMLWGVHEWLVQQRLLDGQGLAGLLSPQQLAAGKAAAEAHQAQQQAQMSNC